MKTRILLFILTMVWMGVQAQTINIHIQESAGECLLSGSCEQNTVCYDLILEIDEPNWQLRSYNIWLEYPAPPILSYNSDNACLTLNGGDSPNNEAGQYRVSGMSGTTTLLPSVPVTIHTFCLQYEDPAMVVNSTICAGGEVLVSGIPFESTLTLQNVVTQETMGIVMDSKDSTNIQISNNQNIDLANGWSGISSWLQPDNPDIVPIMQPVVNDLVVMYNLTDGMYFPSNSINTLVNWNYKSGYVIKNTNAGSVGFCGAEGENTTINLMAGWNIIPVLSPDGVAIEDVFNAIGDNLVLVKEIAGFRLYYPAFQINTLETLQPAKAYFVKVIEPCTINFPDSDKGHSRPASNHFFEFPSPWNEVQKTPVSHVFCFDEISNNGLETGDIIGTFDQQGGCSGIMEVLDVNEPFALSAFGNDNTTSEKDGLNEGEAISFKLWRPSTGEDFNITMEYAENSPNAGDFVLHGISIVKGMKMNALGTNLNNYLSGVSFNVYPNPTQGKCNLEIAGDVIINGKLFLTDSKGQIIFIKPLHHDKSITENPFDLTSVASGVYFIRIVSGNYYNIRKVVKD